MTTASPRPGNSEAFSWPRALEALGNEWRGILGEDALRQVAAVRDEVAGWERELESVRADHDRLRAEGRWIGGPTDLLGVIGYSRSETVHSAVLSWLMDPTSQHGLGTRFVERFLAEAFPGEPASSLAGVRTRTEVECGGGRLDILVDAGDLLVIVENKVDADEGAGQCDFYFHAYEGMPGARFVFLTPTGRRPATATGPAAEAYRSVSYGQVTRALRSALADAKGPTAAGRAAAEQYLAALEKEFG